MGYGIVNVPGASGMESAEAKKLAEAAREQAEAAAKTAAEMQKKLESGEIGGAALSGTDAPTAKTVGAVGQKYLNTATGEEFTCLAAREDGTCVWGVPTNLDVSALPCSYGFFAYDETATLKGAVTVSAFYRMRSAKIIIDSDLSLETLEVDAPGWTVTREEGVVTLETDVTGLSGGQFSVLVDAIRLRQSAAEDLTAAVTLEIIGDETGEVVGADGSAELAFRSGSWAATEGFGLTWEEIETREMTWAELESLGKP